MSEGIPASSSFLGFTGLCHLQPQIFEDSTCCVRFEHTQKAWLPQSDVYIGASSVLVIKRLTCVRY